MLRTTTSWPGRAVTRTGAAPLRCVPTRTDALTAPRVAERTAGAASGWPGTTKVMSPAALAIDVCLAPAADARLRPHQTLNGFCARNAPALPSANRFGDCVAGMRARMRAWKLP